MASTEPQCPHRPVLARSDLIRRVGLTATRLLCLFVCSVLCLFGSLFVSLFVSLIVSLFVSLIVSLFVSLFCLFLCFFVSLFLCFFVRYRLDRWDDFICSANCGTEKQGNQTPRRSV
jgi:cell division protein FtsW (lipid II flippase)